MSKRHPAWNNMIAYPDFEVESLNETSLFWRIEANHPFYTVIKHEVLKVNNYYHEPVVIRNGLWGSRIFLDPEKEYTMGLSYKSNIRLYMGLYHHGSNTPLKNWVLNPTESNASIEWEDTFSIQVQGLLSVNRGTNNSLHRKPLHLKIIIPDTSGEFVELGDLFLTESASNIDHALSISHRKPSEPLQISQSPKTPQLSQTSQLPEIAVGIVTYNRKKHIAALLNQMRSINYPNDKLRIFVVDNASTDGTEIFLQQEFPEVEVLKNSENLGGAGGFNRFFRHLASMNQHNHPSWNKRVTTPQSQNQEVTNPKARNQHLPPFGWLIDDDAVVDKNTLLYLVRAILDDDSVAVAGSVMMNLENPSTVYEAGGELFNDRFGWKANILHTDAGNLMHVNEKTWDSGYAGAYSLLFRTEVIRQVGIWRDYFLHVDDCEWCIRIKRMTGKRVGIALDSLIWHTLQGSKKPFTTLRYYETRNFLDYFAGCKDLAGSEHDSVPNNSGVGYTNYNESEHGKSGYGNKKALLKVMIQTILMGIRQLVIKRDDLCDFHIKGIDDFFEGRFGKQTLERSALFFPDIASLFDEYKKDEKHRGKYPEKVFIVREINNYMGDGTDYEGDIISKIREISPQTVVVDASINHNIRNPFLFKIVVIIKMLKVFFMPSEGVVILPFWNESVIPNNLAKYTAVFENGQYSLYKTGRIKAICEVFKILWKSSFNAVRVAKNKFNPKASHVNF